MTSPLPLSNHFFVQNLEIGLRAGEPSSLHWQCCETLSQSWAWYNKEQYKVSSSTGCTKFGELEDKLAMGDFQDVDKLKTALTIQLLPIEVAPGLRI